MGAAKFLYFVKYIIYKSSNIFTYVFLESQEEN